MGSPTTSLPTRLRRQRGLWVLAMFALLIKVVAATVCLTDGVQSPLTSETADAASVCMVVAAPVDTAANDDGSGACLLGEPGGCHCACAHSVPLTNMSTLSITVPVSRFDRLLPDSSFVPAIAGSLFRPPIA